MEQENELLGEENGLQQQMLAIYAERQAWVEEGLRTAPDLAIRVLAVLVTPI